MKELFRTLPLMCVVLLVPVIPFVIFGAWFEERLTEITHNPLSATLTATLVIGVLATDIFLPVPSSVVTTMSGWQLGWWQGTLASWTGMTLGAVIGFAMARRWGHRFARWFSSDTDLERMQEVSGQYGPLVLVLTRAVPVFAEATVLISGIHRLSWRRFLPAIMLSNLGVSLAYSAFGNYAQQHQWLPLALSVSVAVPVLVAAVAQRFLPRTEPK